MDVGTSCRLRFRSSGFAPMKNRLFISALLVAAVLNMWCMAYFRWGIYTHLVLMAAICLVGWKSKRWAPVSENQPSLSHAINASFFIRRWPLIVATLLANGIAAFLGARLWMCLLASLCGLCWLWALHQSLYMQSITLNTGVVSLREQPFKYWFIICVGWIVFFVFSFGMLGGMGEQEKMSDTKTANTPTNPPADGKR